MDQPKELIEPTQGPTFTFNSEEEYDKWKRRFYQERTLQGFNNTLGVCVDLAIEFIMDRVVGCPMDDSRVKAGLLEKLAETATARAVKIREKLSSQASLDRREK